MARRGGSCSAACRSRKSRAFRLLQTVQHDVSHRGMYLGTLAALQLPSRRPPAKHKHKQLPPSPSLLQSKPAGPLLPAVAHRDSFNQTRSRQTRRDRQKPTDEKGASCFRRQLFRAPARSRRPSRLSSLFCIAALRTAPPTASHCRSALDAAIDRSAYISEPTNGGPSPARHRIASHKTPGHPSPPSPNTRISVRGFPPLLTHFVLFRISCMQRLDPILYP